MQVREGEIMINSNKILAILSITVIAFYIAIAGILTITGTFTIAEFINNLSEVFVGVCVVGMCMYRSFN